MKQQVYYNPEIINRLIIQIIISVLDTTNCIIIIKFYSINGINIILKCLKYKHLKITDLKQQQKPDLFEEFPPVKKHGINRF